MGKLSARSFPFSLSLSVCVRVCREWLSPWVCSELLRRILLFGGRPDAFDARPTFPFNSSGIDDGRKMDGGEEGRRRPRTRGGERRRVAPLLSLDRHILIHFSHIHKYLPTALSKVLCIRLLYYMRNMSALHISEPDQLALSFRPHLEWAV